MLKENQHPEGYWNSPAKKIETERMNMKDIDNKIYSTTLCALQLTVYYRYLPSSIASKDKSLNHGRSRKTKSAAQEKAQKEAAAGEEEINIF